MPIGALVIVLVLALGGLGLSYAVWNESLTVAVLLSTGELDVEFSEPEVRECVDIQDQGQCLPEPAEKEAAASCLLTYDQASDGDSSNDDGEDYLSVQVTGMYPGWHCIVAFSVTNTGSVPVHVAWPQPDSGNPQWIATDFGTCYDTGAQLHQGQSTTRCEIDIHLNSEQAPPEASGPHEFGWTILAQQYNAGAQGGPSVTPGEPDPKVKGYAVRYKAFMNTGGAEEVYLGVGDPGEGNRSSGDKTWSIPGTYPVSFGYDAANDRILETVEGGPNLEYANLSGNIPVACPPGEVDFLLIQIAQRDNGKVSFHNVSLDGHALGNFSGTAGGWAIWTVRDLDFSQGFTMYGDLVLGGIFDGGNEDSKLELLVGCDP